MGGGHGRQDGWELFLAQGMEVCRDGWQKSRKSTALVGQPACVCWRQWFGGLACLFAFRVGVYSWSAKNECLAEWFPERKRHDHRKGLWVCVLKKIGAFWVRQEPNEVFLKCSPSTCFQHAQGKFSGMKGLTKEGECRTKTLQWPFSEEQHKIQKYKQKNMWLYLRVVEGIRAFSFLHLKYNISSVGLQKAWQPRSQGVCWIFSVRWLQGLFDIMRLLDRCVGKWQPRDS